MIRKKLFILLALLSITAAKAQTQREAYPAGSVEVLVKTTAGDFTLLLYGDTPGHRDNFLKIVNEHGYDSVLFHRVINEFMLQAGDPASATRLLGYPVTRQLGQSATRAIGYPVTRALGYPGTRQLGYPATRLPGQSATRSLGHSATANSGTRLLGYPGNRVIEKSGARRCNSWLLKIFGNK